ncbi:hypothetical protein [Corynebacterium amycolatum]|uniref:hypothetical protein n=1 Tax=Corynebacterium amycolatum TaxID=43765 RepID=UPI002159E4C1|nr:hypothetical protein [Corynebacterium amycolatum]UVE01497.1 hypothetical protein NU639_05100 [Corynebacterium amycolatum]
MTMKIVVCVVYPRYPDNTEPLGGFVESEETALAIDNWWRAQPGDMIGTWEDFEVEVNSRDQLLYGVFTGTPTLEITDSNFWDPICYGVYTDREEAERATRACLLIVGLCSSMIEVCHNGLDLRSSRMHSGSELNHFCQRMRAVKAARLVIAAAL